MNILCKEKEPEEMITSQDDNLSETSNITEDGKTLNIMNILNKLTTGNEDEIDNKSLDEDTIIKLIEEAYNRNKTINEETLKKLIDKEYNKNKLIDLDILLNIDNESNLFEEKDNKIKLMDEEKIKIKLINEKDDGIKLLNKVNTEIKLIDLNGLYLEDEIKDTEKQFSIGYSKELNTYFMKILVLWVSFYDRWYKINEEDFVLYKKDKEAFYKKFEIELKQNSQCFTYNLVGSGTLRDYDGVLNIHTLKPSKEGGNSFIGHAFIDDIFYAVIEWEDETIYIPPIQIIDNKYPLRDKCRPYKIDGKLVCYAKVF